MLVSQDSLIESPPEYLLALLNKQFEAPSIGHQRRMPAPPPLNFTIVPADADLAAEANKRFVETLRNLIDQWLDSGRSRTHGELWEAPLERNLGIGTDRDGLWDVLRFWIAQDRFRLSFSNSGEIEMELPCREDTGDEIADAKNDAIRHCAKLLQSRLRYRIAKCSKPQCGRYFYYDRMPKGVLKCGTLCPDHRSHGGTIRKYKQRKVRRERLLTLAAEAWRKCKWNHADNYRWIANQVNKHLRPNEQRITKRFITENDETVKSLAERNHAKS
jgi:hypothetical protein